MRKFADECNAIQSNSLRGTVLRKHVATYCIQLNLNDIEVSDLATFMGHSEKIHKNCYRQPLVTRDILKISQYLEAVQGNQHSSDESLTESNLDDESHNGQLKENSFEMKERENIYLGNHISIFLCMHMYIYAYIYICYICYLFIYLFII